MKLVQKLACRFAVPVLTKNRIWLAFAVAAVTDIAQLLLGPLGWVFVDEALDIIATIVISATLGFHMLLLPTFILEFIPGPDMLPTWMACTAAVVVLRKRAQPVEPQLPPPQLLQETAQVPSHSPQKTDQIP